VKLDSETDDEEDYFPTGLFETSAFEPGAVVGSCDAGDSDEIEEQRSPATLLGRSRRKASLDVVGSCDAHDMRLLKGSQAQPRLSTEDFTVLAAAGLGDLNNGAKNFAPAVAGSRILQRQQCTGEGDDAGSPAQSRISSEDFTVLAAAGLCVENKCEKKPAWPMQVMTMDVLRLVTALTTTSASLASMMLLGDCASPVFSPGRM